MNMRLQKYLARSGVASRRSSEEIIAQGHVSVNGKVVTDMGITVDPDTDEVSVDGIIVQLPQTNITLMLHKPAGYVTTMNDTAGRPTVADLVPIKEYPGLYPIGRLDIDTTGLLLFSTDGELGNILLHPRNHVKKHYVLLAEGKPTTREMDSLRNGIVLDDGMTLPADVEVLEGSAAKKAARLIGDGKTSSGYERRCLLERSHDISTSYIAIDLREGRKRQIRRMFDSIDHPVISLHRESFGSLDLNGLARGSWRSLSDEEISGLYRIAQGQNKECR